MARGLSVRPERTADLPELRELFRRQRWDEFAALPWNDAAKSALLDQQFDAQRRHYAGTHSHLLFLVLRARGGVAGRIYLGATEEGDIRLLDILLSPGDRGRGIGTALIGAVMDHAMADGQRVLLEVNKGNPAVGLYHRLGFQAFADTGVGWHMVWPTATLTSGTHPPIEN